MSEVAKVKRLNDEIDKYLDRLQESHKEVAELKSLIKRYMTTIVDVEGITFCDCMSDDDEMDLMNIYKDESI